MLKNGFSLLEVVIAILILSLSITALTNTYIFSLKKITTIYQNTLNTTQHE